jgi:uncharacterized protein YacL
MIGNESSRHVEALRIDKPTEIPEHEFAVVIIVTLVLAYVCYVTVIMLSPMLFMNYGILSPPTVVVLAVFFAVTLFSENRRKQSRNLRFFVKNSRRWKIVAVECFGLPFAVILLVLVKMPTSFSKIGDSGLWYQVALSGAYLMQSIWHELH